uniref:Uncharacterized protein n=1 Tax=Candidatus Kentrum sp. LFY TaxID=2126342 RepID=A0A450UHQ6_9GAMM|nr:MAG: hypothetical protein BECKLFY1418B_GA0070995_10312 [Candidatus Kentron sp. LFY]
MTKGGSRIFGSGWTGLGFRSFPRTRVEFRLLASFHPTKPAKNVGWNSAIGAYSTRARREISIPRVEYGASRRFHPSIRVSLAWLCHSSSTIDMRARMFVVGQRVFAIVISREFTGGFCHPWHPGPANPWRDDGGAEYLHNRLKQPIPSSRQFCRMGKGARIRHDGPCPSWNRWEIPDGHAALCPSYKITFGTKGGNDSAGFEVGALRRSPISTLETSGNRYIRGRGNTPLVALVALVIRIPEIVASESLFYEIGMISPRKGRHFERSEK